MLQIYEIGLLLKILTRNEKFIKICSAKGRFIMIHYETNIIWSQDRNLILACFPYFIEKLTNSM